MIDKVHVKEHQLSCKFPDNMVYAHDKIIITVTVRVIQISLFLNALMIIKLIMEWLLKKFMNINLVFW